MFNDMLIRTPPLNQICDGTVGSTVIFFGVGLGTRTGQERQKCVYRQLEFGSIVNYSSTYIPYIYSRAQHHKRQGKDD